MPRITLPDGSERSYEATTSAAEVAADIGPGLAKAALGAKIDDVLVDLNHPIDRDCNLAIVTANPCDAAAVLHDETPMPGPPNNMPGHAWYLHAMRGQSNAKPGHAW